MTAAFGDLTANERVQELLTWINRCDTDAAALDRITTALAAARREERESCAKQLEAYAIHIRDHGPTTKEGLLETVAGIHVSCLFDAAALLRAK